MPIERYCAICDEVFTQENDSGEHVIPNALGGRHVVRGFLCKPCNSRTGSEWDAPLVNALQPFCNLLGVRRDRGSVQATQFDMLRHALVNEESTGGKAPSTLSAEDALERVLVQPDGRMTLATPTVTANTAREKRISYRSIAEARRHLKHLHRKYPDATTTLSDKETYEPHVLGWELIVGEPAHRRAITKAALALAVEGGIVAADCEMARKCLREVGKPSCILFYDFDPIGNRVDGMPLHIVCVQGDPLAGHLVGYVELFGFLRFGVCLSTEYGGKQLSSRYAINPMTGEAVEVDVEFHCAPEHIRAMCEGAAVPPEACVPALEGILPTVLRSMEEREQRRVIRQAVEYAFKNLGIEYDEVIEPEQLRRITELVTEKMTPYLTHKLGESRRMREAIDRNGSDSS